MARGNAIFVPPRRGQLYCKSRRYEDLQRVKLARFLITASIAVAMPPAPALAGMPAPFTLREMARLRLETISFFLTVLLLCAALVCLIRNGLRSNVSRLPRL